MSLPKHLKEAIRRVVDSVRDLGLRQSPEGKLSMTGEATEINLKLASLAMSAVNLDEFSEKQIVAFFDKIEAEDEGKGVDIQLLRMSVAIQNLLAWIRSQGMPDMEPKDIVHEALGLPPEHPDILKEVQRIQQRMMKAMGGAAPRFKMSARP